MLKFLPRARLYTTGQVPRIFDSKLKRLQKANAARNLEASRVADYLKDTTAERLVDRMLVSRRDLVDVSCFRISNESLAKFLMLELGLDSLRKNLTLIWLRNCIYWKVRQKCYIAMILYLMAVNFYN